MINSYYSSAAWRGTMLGSFSDLRKSLDTASLQLSSGMKSPHYAGLGSDAMASIHMHTRLDSIDAYSDLISNAQTEIKFTSQSLTSIDSVLESVSNNSLSLAGGSDKSARLAAQSGLKTQFQSLISYFRTQGTTGYVFGGKLSATPPVADSDLILNGDASHAGLMTLYDERYAADSGANGMGRLVVARTGNQVSIAEEAGGLPFGLKLASVESKLSNTDVSQATGTPPTESLTFNGQPALDDLVTLNFNLPDGSKGSVTLRVAATAGVGQFVLGATPDETAQNFQTALQASISNLVKTDLSAASAVATAQNFFASDADHPPQRVSGNPPSAATALVAGTPANTVIWYNGTADNRDPRTDRSVMIGDDVSIDLGVRANESGFQSVLAGIAAALIVTQRFSTDETTASSQLLAVRQRANKLIQNGKKDIQAVVAAIASSQNVAKQIGEQNTSLKTLLQGRLFAIEGVDKDLTAVTISSMSTQLQASYQVTSKLLNLSLSSYL